MVYAGRMECGFVWFKFEPNSWSSGDYSVLFTATWQRMRGETGKAIFSYDKPCCNRRRRHSRTMKAATP
jgi:hypothetical protein